VKVVHLTSVHPAFDTRVLYRECKALVEAGHKVVLVAPHDQEEMVGGVRLRAVPRPKGRWERFTGTVRAVYKAAVMEDADVYHFHDPELIPACLLLRFLTGSVVIYDVHEDLPLQILNKYWIPRWLRAGLAKIVQVVEKVSAWFLDGIVAATPTIAERFPQEKTESVQNFPIIDELVYSDVTVHVNSPSAVVYIGGINYIRGIREMVQAMELLPKSLPAKLILAGRFDPPELGPEIAQMPGWDQVEFLGWQSREGVGHLLSRARVGLVLLHPRPNYIQSYPVKLFEYMSAGVPVVASDFPLWRAIIGHANCGLLVDPLDPRAIAEAIQWLLEHPVEAEAMGKRGQEAVHERYNWGRESKKLLSLYQRLLR
jgi:glycosyltransferase involved in cell wall biosynthesis